MKEECPFKPRQVVRIRDFIHGVNLFPEENLRVVSVKAADCESGWMVTVGIRAYPGAKQLVAKATLDSYWIVAVRERNVDNHKVEQESFGGIAK